MDLGPYYAGMRYAIATGGAIAATLGIISSVDAASLTAAFNDINEGVKLIMKGGGTIALIAAPIWGIIRSKLSSKASDVKAADPAVLAQAMTKITPTEMVIAVKEMPEVKGVVTTNTPAGRQLADSIPSNTVAAAGTTDAKVIAATGATS